MRNLERRDTGGDVVPASPASFRAFWPLLRDSHLFRNRRDFLAFMGSHNGRIFLLSLHGHPASPFVLTGNWRCRCDISALWYTRAWGEERRRLVLHACEACLEEGAESFITRPLCEEEAEEFSSWGFRTLARVVVLEKELCGRPEPPTWLRGVRLRRFRPGDLSRVLQVDAEAFDEFWSLDRRTLRNVAESCHSNVFLVAAKGDETLGYAVGGVNGRLAYLQRLGVHPSEQGKGVGEMLSSGMLCAFRALGAALVSVNTQEDNQRALSLYHKLGFKETGDRRYIMCRDRRGGPRSAT